MIEDMEYDGLNALYKQQPPLRPPPMNPPTSVRASVSPRFENLMTRSGSVPWSPAPLNAPQYEKTSVDPLSSNHSFTKSSDPWLNNNAYTKSSDLWSNNHNMQSKTSDIWSPRNTFIKPAESTMISNNSSNAQMIKSSNKTCGCITDRCSPRCQLGILGFIIGFLIVGIALAVILVLWLRA